MKNLFVFLVMLILFYGLGFISGNKRICTYSFMSYEHSNAYRAVAALMIIFQHVAGKFGICYLTPLGGIGVAVFLISSGYGLNESYKRRGIRVGYWKPKIIRVFLPYIIVIVVYILSYKFMTKSFLFPYYWYLDFM